MIDSVSLILVMKGVACLLSLPDEILQLNRVARNLHGEPLFLDVNLSVRRGETVAIIGCTPAMSHALDQLLLGQCQPHFGRILFDGRELTQTNPRISLIDGHGRLSGWASTVKNILIKTGHRKREDAFSALSKINAEPLIQQSVNQLTVPQQLQIKIAHALVTAPKLLVWDHPFTGLTSEDRFERQIRLRFLGRQESLTQILMTDDLHEAIHVADRIVLFAHQTVLFEEPGLSLADRENPIKVTQLANRLTTILNGDTVTFQTP
ncbi:ATP-binding cassette domain-containing protein [Levilactobacillus bambusae]|uniref:ABC transporter domain-containing protein n=1 Tax=Levilactobacillus bambusae TaxID=2024736 RepID=A0A2V1MZN4_9LACO|nr:ATP-binding cassette domain-containing protein [Levilactobacillus bambusae]PWG00223.1 hypothetical protein DCM90_04625 [Levilactobacillus bambusae]